MSRAVLEQALTAGLAALELELDADQQRQLIDYVQELERWNRSYNLTALSDPVEMVHRHLIDSLAILPWIRGPSILDAGTGAGLPGIPLAIARPELRFMLVDSSGKKVRFLRHVCRRLALDHVEPVQARLEAFHPQPPPEQIVARALAPLERLVEQLDHWLEAGAELLAMKGPQEEQERAALADAYNSQSFQLNVPGADGLRRLVVLRKS